jgi:hypothetical protein
MTSNFALHNYTYVCIYHLQAGDFELASKILGGQSLLQPHFGPISFWHLENSFWALGWLVGNAC